MSSLLIPVLILPLPTEIPVGFGIHATSGPYGCLLQTRGTVPEREKIQQAAARLGLTYGTFMRRIVNDAADYVLINFPEQRR